MARMTAGSLPALSVRPVLLLLHRWVGLTIATFLIIAGATGAVISWDHELDDLLNPSLTTRSDDRPQLSAFDLVRSVEARDPRIRVTYLPLQAEAGHTLAMFVEPRIDPATGSPCVIDYNQVFVDPATGVEAGRRFWGAVWPITRKTAVSFLYKLHYSLHVPAIWGEERWGLWLMGAVAGIWVVDCFVGFYLTLPSAPTRRDRGDKSGAAAAKNWWMRWKPAWRIKRGASWFRVNVDLHRAFSLWTFAFLLIIAFTAFSLNLYREIFYPVMSTISQVTPSPFDVRRPRDRNHPIVPAIASTTVVAVAQEEAKRRGWREPAGALAYDQTYGIFSVLFYRPGEDDAAGGVGPARLYYDSAGALLGERRPWTGTAADIFVQAQFPLHSGRILGLPGRILISLMGIVVCVVSVTGLVIWWRKRAARVLARRRRADEPVIVEPQARQRTPARYKFE